MGKLIEAVIILAAITVLDDAANATSNPTVRLGNYQQISSKFAIVTDTENAIKKAGRGNEMSYQIAKRLGELKREHNRALLA